MRSRLSTWLIWAVLAIPAAWMAWRLGKSTSPRIYHILVRPSGEWSAYFLILTLMVTPISLLFRGQAWTRRLVQNRRYLGVAAFAYGLLHTVFYLIDRGTAERVLNHLPRFDIWTGWLAFVVFLPLAATSTDWAMRKLGRWWKPVQRWAYGAAILTLLHWASLHRWGRPEAALYWFAPLAALTLYRLWWLRTQRRRPVAV